MFTQSVPLVMALIIFCVVSWNSDSTLDYFMLSIGVSSLAAFLENMSEPYYVDMLLTQDLAPRVKAEGIAFLVKSIITYILLKREWHLLSYAIAQLTYSISLLALYPLLSKSESDLYTVKELKADKEKTDPSLSNYILDE